MDDRVRGRAGAETIDLSASYTVRLKLLPREAPLLQAKDVMG